MIGAGKTTLGRRLAARLGRPFHDLDGELEREIGGSFHDLVREQGWLAFREVEYRVCKRFAALHDAVCALGGGTVRYEWNVDVLRGTGVLILLEADLAALAERVRRADRPRVNAGVTLEEDLERIWTVSADRYRAVADAVYRTDRGRSVGQEIEDLLVLLRDRGVATPARGPSSPGRP